MRVRLPIIAVASFALAACGGGGPGGGGASPAGLAYAVPTPATVTYMTADTSYIDIDAMGQVLAMSQAASATVDATFTRGADGVEVTLTYQEFSARLDQPMGAPVTADEGGIDGALVFSMDRMGNVTMGSSPTVRGNAAQLFAPMSTAYNFFPGLPGTGVAAGDMWSDTVSYSGPEGPGQVDATVIMEYTVVGDVTVDGRSLLRIDMTGSTASDTEASIEGMDVFQSMTAAIEGHMLWDMQAGVMYERVLMVEGEGSTEVSAAPMAMGMAVRGTAITRLVN